MLSEFLKGNGIARFIRNDILSLLFILIRRLKSRLFIFEKLSSALAPGTNSSSEGTSWATACSHESFQASGVIQFQRCRDDFGARTYKLCFCGFVAKLLSSKPDSDTAGSTRKYVWQSNSTCRHCLSSAWNGRIRYQRITAQVNNWASVVQPRLPAFALSSHPIRWAFTTLDSFP